MGLVRPFFMASESNLKKRAPKKGALKWNTQATTAKRGAGKNLSKYSRRLERHTRNAKPELQRKAVAHWA
jgi:hypothetical protein